MFATDEEKLYLENLLYAIQNIGSGADPALEGAKLRLGCLNASVQLFREIQKTSETVDPEDVIGLAKTFENYVVGGYRDAALVRFAVPVPMRSTLASESDVAIGTGQ
jgi:hypothetical protein